MKKWILCLLSAALLLSLTACGNTEAPQDDAFDEAALLADAQWVSDSLRNGEYDAVAEKFDAQMAAAVSTQQLGEAWEMTVTGLGAYLERVSATGAAQGGYYSAEVIEKFESNGVSVRVTYSKEGEIAGLLLTYADVSEPVRSDEYTEVDITVAGNSEFPLGGTLTLPTGADKPPVVILIQGSGSSDRNEFAFGSKPFADIAHGLAQRGIASIRYDKRYYSYPDSAIAIGASVTLEDEVLEDAYAAISLARSDERVDGSRVYVLGHSLGGMLLPAIADANPGLSGLISVAGTLRPLWEVSYDQNQEALAAAYESELSEAEKTELDAQAAQVEADIAVLRGDFSELSDDAVLMGMPVGYLKSLKQYCGENYIDRVTVPMLIMQGGADFQVYPDVDYVLWQEALAGRDNVSFRLYEGLNHLMMPTQGKRDVTEYQVPGNVDTQVIADIADFILGE